jgi:uncharacterized NAD(P)/FAD-binding protein YdhS
MGADPGGPAWAGPPASYRPPAVPGRSLAVAVIGGGASGTLAVVHLLRAAAGAGLPLRITLIDRLGRHGLGQAYSTTCPEHLLNSRTSRMSALAGDPGHLVRWAAAAGLPSVEFLPRMAYGRYLSDLLAEAERAAAPLSRVTRMTAGVLAIRPGTAGRPLRVRLEDGCLDADVAILATGNIPPGTPVSAPASPAYIADPWSPGALAAASDGRPVLILGTGLTMVDIALAVTGAHPGTAVHAVSRHGLLPQVHRGHADSGPPLWLPALDGPAGPVRLGDLMWQVRAALSSRPWQDVVDALRPQVPGLWLRLPERDKRMFLRHVARYWEIHRHRMPPATARQLTMLRAARRLSVQPGRVTGISETAGGRLRVAIASGGRLTEREAGWVINATGPSPDITTTPDLLLRDLLAIGLARPDPFRLGLDATPSGAVLSADGQPSPVLFTLGPPLRGVRYETTAIPEIRDQAESLARHLTAALAVRPGPGSAA